LTGTGAVWAATTGVSAGALPFPPGRLRRRLRRGVGVDPAGAGDSAPAVVLPACAAGCLVGGPVTWRLTVAPTSPSAHIAPSAVCRSTRHTTIDDVAPVAGGRFWVKVQRA
jgi:hypothetical protein